MMFIIRRSEYRFLQKVMRREVAYGTSSLAMVNEAMFGGEPGLSPRDMDDFGRCLSTYRVAPPHLQRKFQPIMDRYAELLRIGVAPDIVPGLDEQWPPDPRSFDCRPSNAADGWGPRGFSSNAR